ncbi:hypothetical protein [Tahibacter caeni]|uniref:hypothetical protein n=1 Tax=Tahibacter caeni TaxID=1453545 RepID=UPI0021498E67|nr:hypothetical protein [Tahibacter caeni]
MLNYETEHDDAVCAARKLLRVFIASGRRAGTGMPMHSLSIKALGMPNADLGYRTAIEAGWLTRTDNFVLISEFGTIEAMKHCC